MKMKQLIMIYKKELQCVFLCMWMSFLLSAHSQLMAEKPGEQEYRSAQSFVWDSISKKLYQNGVYPQWFGDDLGFAYALKTRKGTEYFKSNFSDLKQRPAFDPKKFKNALEKLSEDKIDEKNLPINMIHWSNANQFNFSYKGNNYRINLKNYKIDKIENPYSAEENISISPDKNLEVFLRDYNLILRNRKTNEETPLTKDGNQDYMYGSVYGWSQTMKGENTIAKPNLKVKWSPDSKKILTQVTDFSSAEKMYLLDFSIDSLYRPELLSYYRPSPGDTTFVKLNPLIIDIESKEIVPIKLKPTPQMLDLGGNLFWSKKNKRIYGTYDRRGFQQKDYLDIDPETGEINIVYTEESKTNIDYLTRFRYLEEENIALITSESSGWKQLYKLDWKTGKRTALTQGEFVVDEIKSVDLKEKQIYFTAMGKEQGVNPYFRMLYKIDFDGNNLKLLTPEKLNHEVHISSDHQYFIDNYSSPLHPTISVLRSTSDGKILSKITEADLEDLKQLGWQFPEIFETIAQDGKTKIYGIMWKPSNFDASKKYPVVDYSYTGPHMNVFPNSFSQSVYGLYNSVQSLAELGFIVVQIDGMGTAGRSKAFHNVSYKNMGNNLLDHTLAIQQLGEKYDWFDADRVGIYGHSAGGYDAAHALMAFPETYKVAVASAADHDWRMEKAWWPEYYVGWPVDEYYHDHSNITMAPKMQGKLLLIHGGIDENVNPSATFKLAEALIKADKYFDMLIVPSARHAYPKKYYPYVQRKRWDFFVEHLIVNPVK